MSRYPLLFQTVRENRRGFVAWGAILAAIAALYTAFFRQYADNPDLAASLTQLPEWMQKTFSFQDMSGAGWLTSTTYGLVVPIATVIMAVTFVGRVLPGDEEAGIVDLYLAYPLSRTRLVLERFGAFVLLACFTSTIVALVVAGFNVGFDMGVAPAHIAGMTVVLVLLATVYGALTLLVGCLTGRRGLTSAVAGAAGAAGYMFDALGKQFDEASFLRTISPFYHYIGPRPLHEGLDPGHTVVLAGTSAVLVLLGLWAFNRRDIQP